MEHLTSARIVMTKPNVRVLIADDHNLVRAGIAALLHQDPQISIVGEAADGKEAVEKAQTLSPHIVLLDIAMPVIDGIEATRSIVRRCPDVSVIVLTQHDSEEYIRRMVEVGAKGYLLKSSLAQDLLTAIHVVGDGEEFFASSVSKVMISSYVKKATDSKTRALTKREVEILKLVAEGYSSPKIAGKLFLSVRTVEFHRANISGKLQIHDTAGLTRYALQHKLVELK